jgi:hypothetical protein
MPAISLSSALFIIVWIIIPFLHFIIWHQLAKGSQKRIVCIEESSISSIKLEAVSSPPIHCPSIDSDGCAVTRSDRSPHIELMNSVTFDESQLNRPEKLAKDVVYVMGTKNTVIVHRKPDEACERYVSHTSGTIVGKFCFAAVYYQDERLNYTYNLVRSDRNIDEAGQVIEPDYNYKLLEKMKARLSTTMIKLKNKLLGPYLKLNKFNIGKLRPTGFFRTPPKKEGRLRLQEKMEIFLKNFEHGSNSITKQLKKKLADNNIEAGDDLIVMVVNEGEIDLYMNFACSCQLHDISLDHLIVFAGSQEIVKVIEATGAMALYHKGYGAVSKKASNDYLDRTFVDMMWYKAFSIFLILREGINILFQDVDLVWFRDPFPYFHDFIKTNQPRSDMTGSHPEAFFSDDGQRSHRYTPYFANSGFYYILSSPRSINFAWSIMTAFAIIQVGGSHQNVFTMRLLEGLGLSYPQAKLLPMVDFPGGMMFHHNKKFMKKISDHQAHPYHFHM